VLTPVILNIFPTVTHWAQFVILNAYILYWYLEHALLSWISMLLYILYMLSWMMHAYILYMLSWIDMLIYYSSLYILYYLVAVYTILLSIRVPTKILISCYILYYIWYLVAVYILYWYLECKWYLDCPPLSWIVLLSWMSIYTILLSWMSIYTILLSWMSMLIYYTILITWILCCIYTILYWYISRDAPQSYLECIYYTILIRLRNKIILLLYIYYTVYTIVILNTALRRNMSRNFRGQSIYYTISVYTMHPYII
jgi:hypothetical protein